MYFLSHCFVQTSKKRVAFSRIQLELFANVMTETEKKKIMIKKSRRKEHNIT